MKKLLLPMIIGVAFLLAPVLAIGANLSSITGSVQGFNCVTQGKVCPIGYEDPVIAVENVFVLLVDAAKGEYYFVPNVDRGILARHINKQVRIEGRVNVAAKTVRAAELYVQQPDGAWKKTWSSNWEDQIYQDIMGGHPLTPRGSGD